MARTEHRAAKKYSKSSFTWGRPSAGKLPHAGKEMSICRVDVDADGEEQVHEMHPSVLVNAYESDLI